MELKINTIGAEIALKKVNRLVDLLKEAKILIKEISEMNVDICLNNEPLLFKPSIAIDDIQ